MVMRKDPNQPLILAWNTLYNEKIWLVKPNSCPYKCNLTYDRSKESQASLIMFHARNTRSFDLPRSNAPRIFFSIEPPWLSYLSHGSLPSDYFNYTMTYKRNSDARMIYQPRWPKYFNLSDEKLDEIIAKKTKLALVASSHCQVESKRTEMVKHLQKFMEITTLGKCFNNKQACKDGCFNKLMESHFFYLAFENAICPEYATEKFTRFVNFIVPVVFRRSVIPKEYPQDIFIAMDDFKNTEEFVAYLKMVAFNKELYKRYLKWSQRPKPKNAVEPEELTCQLCRLAHLQPHKISNYKEDHSPKECDQKFVPEWIKRNEENET
ncbi:unnamed protein product [Bursaphelenchus xylophilus]|uniref:Fucosyltransferase n=1 Tax=Bursaphelenchus xylophilus TaxID=6326 RepID=A0A1I7RZH8_BURXY|nr:unnamed protein product [Bursaphelenchus xylophilus]CAG9106364.1 unnamed protein product [Bursaphelenchus xylophilus]